MEEKLKDEDEIEIDLGKFFGLLWDRRKIVGAIVAVCTVVAMVFSFILPPVYHSTTLVQTSKSSKIDLSSGANAALALLGGGGASASTVSYMELMKSRAVLEPIMDQLEDVTPEQRERMTATEFASGHLELENIEGTNLINVVGKGRTPEEAQMISANVVENFLKLMTNMNQNTQSYMVRFLNERISTAKEDSDEASGKLEQYSSEHKVYLPDDQVKAMVDRESVYDKSISEFIVNQQAAAAKIAATSSELEKQNAKLVTFNMTDEGVAADLRGQIVAQEVAIVTLEQKYTDNHPEIINAREQLTALKERLSSEVATAVASGTVSMNPTQSALLKDLTMAQVELAVANASESAVRAQMEKADSDLDQLSADALEYLKLKRDADIKNEVYVALVKQSEQAKIEATMESMDIQVIDKANLPLDKSSPNRKLITVGGMFLGVFICIMYGLLLYRREVN